MNKLNVCVMGENCEKFLPMCLKSVKDADNIIYCDGGSTDNSVELAIEYSAVVIENTYNQEDKGMNGKQRNYYLDYLKKHHMGEWVLVLDADEVVDDITKIREFIDNPPKDMRDIISVKMRHFIENLGQEDVTMETHYVPHRLFKIKEELIYSETEHAVLWETKDNKPIAEKDMFGKIGYFNGTTIWHLAYCPGIFDIRKRYKNHIKKSEMHSKEYLDDWYYAHLFGLYPKKRINAMEIPNIILNEFHIDKDMIYYSTHNRLETKHYIMTKQWIDYFGHEDFKPLKVLDLGCGVGLFGYALDSYGVTYTGMEKSQWAVDNTVYKHLDIKRGDIIEEQNFKDYDLVLVLDVLEHLNYNELDRTLECISNYGTQFLFSIPYIGDPNLELDSTHIIKESKEWWITQLNQFFKVMDVPKEFMYGKQMLIGECK